MHFPRVPVEPILNAIAARGGIHNLPSMGVPLPDPDKPGELKMSRNAAERAALVRTRNRINEAKAAGSINYYVADAVCCEALRVHPAAVYGEAWYEFTSEDDLREEALTA